MTPPSHLVSGARVSKRRSTKACSLCRARKVRCDVTSEGIPCGNCRHHGSECIVTERQSRQRTSTQAPALPPRDGDANAADSGTRRRSQSLASHSSSAHIPVFDSSRAARPIAISSAPAQASNPGARVSQSAAGPPSDTMKPASLAPYQSPASLQSPLESRWGYEGLLNGPAPLDRPRAAPTSTPLLHSPAPSRQTRNEFWAPEVSLPDFVQPLPVHLQPEDVDHLRRKGAFIIPETSLRDSLLACYLQFVHPYMPVVELQELLPIVDKNCGLPSISLILLQAIMLSATPYVDMRCLSLHGYSSRRTLRKVFYQRVKLLCDLDYEMNRFTILRSVLLMTCWNEDPDHPKGSLFWIDVAISHARTLKLDSCIPDSDTKTREERLRRRVWWTCYCRDRLSALALRRHPRLTDDSFDVSMLEEDDFDADPIPESLLPFFAEVPAVQDAHGRPPSLKLLIALVDLCQCVGQILLRTKSGRSSFAIPETMVAEKKLRAWSDEYLQEFDLNEPIPSDTQPKRGLDPIYAFKAILAGLYQTVIITLYRPHVVQNRSEPEIFEFSLRKVRDAAERLTSVLSSVEANSLTSSLPSTAVTCVVAAASIHLRDLKTGRETQKHECSQHLRVCLRALQKLGDMYASAAFAFHFLNIATAKAQEALSTPHALGESDRASWRTHRTGSLHPRQDVRSLMEDRSQARGPSLDADGTNPITVSSDRPSWSSQGPHVPDVAITDSLYDSVYSRRDGVSPNFFESPHLTGLRNLSDMALSSQPADFWAVENRDNLASIADGLGADFDEELFNMLGGDNSAPDYRPHFGDSHVDVLDP